jgi:5-methylcytosine-specific restriction endonuclease McrA
MPTATIFCYLCGKKFLYEYKDRLRGVMCPDCVLEIMREKAADRRARLGKEEYNQQQREYARQHPEFNQQVYQRRKEMMEADPEYADELKKRMARFRKSAKGRQTIKNGRHRRRSKFKEQGKWMLSASDWEKTLKAFGEKCVYCGRSDVDLTQDHFIPLSQGGTTTLGNIVPACLSCNSKKKSKMPKVFAKPEVYSSIVKVLNSLSST